jgi:hypothetical protein
MLHFEPTVSQHCIDESSVFAVLATGCALFTTRVK